MKLNEIKLNNLKKSIRLNFCHCRVNRDVVSQDYTHRIEKRNNSISFCNRMVSPSSWHTSYVVLLYLLFQPFSHSLWTQPFSRLSLILCCTRFISSPRAILTCILNISSRTHKPLHTPPPHLLLALFCVIPLPWRAVCPLAEAAHLFSVGTDFKDQATSGHYRRAKPTGLEGPGASWRL